MAASTSGDAVEAFVRDLDRLDGDLVRLRVQHRAFPLADPAVAERPAGDVGPVVVLEDDRAVAAFDLPVDDRLAPVPQLEVLRDAAAQDEVRVLREAGQLADVGGVATEAVLDDGGLAREAADLA